MKNSEIRSVEEKTVISVLHRHCEIFLSYKYKDLRVVCGWNKLTAYYIFYMCKKLYERFDWLTFSYPKMQPLFAGYIVSPILWLILNFTTRRQHLRTIDIIVAFLRENKWLNGKKFCFYISLVFCCSSVSNVWYLYTHLYTRIINNLLYGWVRLYDFYYSLVVHEGSLNSFVRSFVRSSNDPLQLVNKNRTHLPTMK